MVTGEARRVAGPVGLFLLVLAVVLAPLAPASAAPGDPGTIAGTVYDPISSTPPGPPSPSTTRPGSRWDPPGHGGERTFEFGGLDGMYYVGATKAAWARCSTTAPLPSTTPPRSSADPVRGVVDLQLIPPPVIAGTVSNAGGPIDGADVTAYEYDAIDDFWSAADFASTDAAGHYAFAGLAPKAYRLRFSASGTGERVLERQGVAVDRRRRDRGGRSRAAGERCAREPHGGLGQGHRDRRRCNVANASVAAEQQVTDEFGDTYWDEVDFAFSAADGTYTLRVPAGPTRISVRSDGLPHGVLRQRPRRR